MPQRLESARRLRSAAGPAEDADDLRAAPEQRTGWRQNAWLVPVTAALFALVVVTAPRYLTFNPATQPVPMNPAAPGLHYGLLVAHVISATVAIVTACLGVWPWLRIRHVAVHRWSGRLYVLLGALPSALLTLALNSMHSGWQGDIGAYAQGGIWFITTLIGYLAIRGGNEIRHRRWMLYSFAMTTSVIWGPVAGELVPVSHFDYVLELTRWVGWLVPLLAVKWWLDRTERREAVAPVPAG